MTAVKENNIFGKDPVVVARSVIVRRQQSRDSKNLNQKYMLVAELSVRTNRPVADHLRGTRKVVSEFIHHHSDIIDIIDIEYRIESEFGRHCP